jgi:hypothetical protein
MARIFLVCIKIRKYRMRYSLCYESVGPPTGIPAIAGPPFRPAPAPEEQRSHFKLKFCANAG